MLWYVLNVDEFMCSRFHALLASFYRLKQNYIPSSKLK